MNKVAKIVILDEVNIHIQNIDLKVKKALTLCVRYFIPSAKFSHLYKLGRWDGYMSYAKLSGHSYLTLLDKLIPVLQINGYEFEIDDQRENHSFSFPSIDENYLSDICWPAGHRFENQPIQLRDYQVDAINNCLNNIQSVSVLPTGAGKTIISASLSKLVEPYGRSIIIVPNKNLVQQTEEDYKNIGLDVGVLYGDRKEYDKKHTICTWQSLNILDKKNKDSLDDDQLDIFLKDIICVMCDECHLITDQKVLHHLMTNTFRKVPIRWGLTGTVPEEEYKQVGLWTSIGLLSETSLTAKELQDKGALANCNITILQTQETVNFRNYQSELKFLVSDDDRLQWMAKSILDISINGNTFVLVDRIETGEKLSTLLGNAVFVSGDTKTNDRRDYYKELNFSDNKIILATFGVASTGISINRIFNLVMVESGKSFVRCMQSLGRGLRMADDKDEVNIYDICSKTKYSNTHLLKRKKFYKNAEYPFVVIKVNY